MMLCTCMHECMPVCWYARLPDCTHVYQKILYEEWCNAHTFSNIILYLYNKLVSGESKSKPYTK